VDGRTTGLQALAVKAVNGMTSDDN